MERIVANEEGRMILRQIDKNRVRTRFPSGSIRVSRTNQVDEIILPSNDSAILFLIRVDSLDSRWAAASDFNWLNCYLLA
jgi:hypothetical protein